MPAPNWVCTAPMSTTTAVSIPRMRPSRRAASRASRAGVSRPDRPAISLTSGSISRNPTGVPSDSTIRTMFGSINGRISAAIPENTSRLRGTFSGWCANESL
ncbi:Uncharacterised protein [Mycobacteroides abscessus subsp. abscessus]|nr:Uncharacterised protein [Mycobacteroides abscessus subsp. abscessus]